MNVKGKNGEEKAQRGTILKKEKAGTVHWSTRDSLGKDKKQGND